MPVLRRRKIVRVRQHDATDCGAACLYSVAAHHGLKVPLARIRDHASTDRTGSNVLGLVEAAEKLGFEARGVRGRRESLGSIPTPAIAHVAVGMVRHHFVVLQEVSRRGVLVMDPADGRARRIPTAEFIEIWTGVLILLVPSSRFRSATETQSATRRLWELLRPHRSVLAQAFIGAAVHTLLGLSTAIYVQKIVDHALPSGDRALLNLLGVGMIAILAAQSVIGWIRERITLVTGQKIDAALLLGYHRHLLRLPQRFFDTRRIGEISSRMGDAVKIRAFINDVALNLMISALVLVFAGAVMLSYSPALAMVVLMAIPVYVGIYAVNDRLNRRTQRELMEGAAEVEAELVEGLQSISTVRAFVTERWSMLRLETRLVRLLRAVHRSGTTAIGTRSALDLVSRLVTVVLLWSGGSLVIRGGLTTGELMSFYALAAYVTGPIVTLVSANRSVRDALIAADRLFQVMDLEGEADGARAGPPPRIRGDIRFEDVVFRYGARPPVLDGLSLRVKEGSMTAIVGESGSGKTTLASLLHALYPLSAGRIMVGRFDVRDLDPATLRRQIGVVPQKVSLLSATVAENVALGELEPDLDRVARVCEAVGILELIHGLPHGFATTLGEDGVQLSGGERQRIAVARALYTEPRILLFDEATSSLDAHAESHVHRVIEDLRADGRTVIVISHRLASVAAADRIVVLGAGRVLEEGTHGELIGGNGAYRRLWERQYPPDLAPGGERPHRRSGPASERLAAAGSRPLAAARPLHAPPTGAATAPAGAWLERIV